MNPLRQCIESGHEVVEDSFVWQHCKERLLCCRTCHVYYICIERAGEVIPRLSVKAKGVTNKELARLLTFESIDMQEGT